MRKKISMDPCLVFPGLLIVIAITAIATVIFIECRQTQNKSTETETLEVPAEVEVMKNASTNDVVQTRLKKLGLTIAPERALSVRIK